MSYIKNIGDLSERRDQAEFVSIGAQEVEALHIDRPEIDGNSIVAHGKSFKKLNVECVEIFMHFCVL